MTISLDLQDAVLRLADKETRTHAVVDLELAGDAGIAAATEALSHADWRVRQWSAVFLDHHSNEAALQRLVLTLDDPKARVRQWAVHSIACEPCKSGENPIDVTPLLIKRVKEDKAVRVRRTAVIQLALRMPDRRIARFLRGLLATEADQKTRRFAAWGLRRHNELSARPS